MLGNYRDISPKCEGCCFEGEPYFYSLYCDQCICNTKSKNPTALNWTDKKYKDKYFDAR